MNTKLLVLRNVCCLKFIFFIAIIILVFSSPLYGEDKSVNNGDDSEKAINKDFSATSFPIIYYTPETSSAGGIGTVFTYRKKGSTKKDRPDNLAIMGIYTMKDQSILIVEPDVYLDDQKWQIKIKSVFLDYPDKFFGIGNNTDKENEEDFTIKHIGVQPSILRSLFTNFRAGLVYFFMDTDIVDKKAGGILDSNIVKGSEGGVRSGLGPALEWDSRDNIFYPSKGSWLQLYSVFYKDGLGSDFDFDMHTLDFRKYTTIKKNRILALQLFIRHMKGDVPFTDLATLGGDHMRGILGSRFTDKNKITAQAEYRFPISQRFSGVTFAAIGDVANKPGNFKFDEFKYTYGGGIRYALNKDEKINLRFDIGVGPWGVSPYIVIREAF